MHDDQSVMLSALEHFEYCPRQCGLIHLEQTFTEDGSTTRGSLAHERVNQESTENRSGIRFVRSLPVYCDALGLHGVADLVEFEGGHVTPIEYKLGRHRAGGPAELQLAGQALCLESMFSVEVLTGYIYSVAERRRHRVAIDLALRRRVIDTIAKIREMLDEQRLPAAQLGPQCDGCSLVHDCLPNVLSRARSVSALTRALFIVDDGGDDPW